MAEALMLPLCWLLLVQAPAPVETFPPETTVVPAPPSNEEALPPLPPDARPVPDTPEPADELDGHGAAAQPNPVLTQPEPLSEVKPRASVWPAVLGGAPGLLAGVPSLVLCCGSAALMGLVYPLSKGDPTVDCATSCWPTACALGVLGGMAGWGLGLCGTGLGSMLVAFGMLVGPAAGDVWNDGKVPGPPSPAARAAVLAAVVAGAPALLVAALSGALPWLAAVLWTSFARRMPDRGGWVYGRWLALNTLFMGAVLGGLVMLSAAAVLPFLSGVVTYGLVARLE
jgi:hypothetical protein